MSYRTNYAGEITKELVGKKVKLVGFVDSRRDHGGLIFIDLRDCTGKVQVVFDKTVSESAFQEAKKLKDEFIVQIEGIVKERPKNLVNPKIETGAIEIPVSRAKTVAESRLLPFKLSLGEKVEEDLRLRYRYLDLRRPEMLKMLKLRQEVKNFTRRFMAEKGFIEIDTPILTKSTPEGARDFIVPSRLHKGKFYALPQSPQQYKQLLMVAGVDKYFQFPRCFRDEDMRADRVFEFDQFDIEMSFVEREDILNLTEELMIKITEKVLKKKIQEKPFPRLTYREAMERYKTDSPDLRKNKKDKNTLAFVWVIDFPLFEWRESEKKWGPSHHPFTAPNDEDIEILKTFKDPKELGKVRSKQYDLVVNGSEIFGGSIRITDPKLQSLIFEILGHSRKDIKKKFSHLLEAFSYGVPPHGGIAPGVDRFLAILLEEPNIREVIAFPKTGDNRDLMMDVPSEVTKEQLKELHLRITKKKK